MTRVITAYVSDMGHTATLAEQVAAGAREAGAEVALRTIPTEGLMSVTMKEVESVGRVADYRGLPPADLPPATDPARMAALAHEVGLRPLAVPDPFGANT